MRSTRSCAGRRAQVPDAVDLRGPDRLREPGDVVSPRPHRARRAGSSGAPQDIIEQVEAVAARSSCETSCDRLAELLSHGQKQWLEIGMLLIQEPELLMLDEPVAGMSVHEREQDRRAAQADHQGPLGDRDRARHGVRRAIAHRVTVLHQGKVLAEGSMDKVQTDPKVIEVYLGH